MADDSEKTPDGAPPGGRRARPADDRWPHQFVELFRAHQKGPEALRQAFEENRRLVAEPIEERAIDDADFLAAHAEPVTKREIFERPRRQHYYFAHQFLPERVSGMPRYMINQLRGEAATRYLKVQWAMSTLPLGLEREDMADGEELQCFAVELGEPYLAAVVRMPVPERMTEAYYVAVAVRPAEEPEAEADDRYITLELSANDAGTKTTVLGEWDGPSGDTHVNYGPGPAPELESFLSEVRGLLGIESESPR